MLILFAVALSVGAQSDVVLSRADAEAMSSEKLVSTVLANVPHDRIVKVTLPDTAPGPHGEKSDPSLTYISFKDAGTVAGGRVCKARTIIASFDWLAGQGERPLAERSARDEKRLFNVSSRPTIAVLDEEASAAACSALPPERYASLDPPAEHEGRLRHFIDLTDAYTRRQDLPAFLQCGDWRGVDEKPCAADQALARIGWSRLFSVNAVEWPHGVSATRLTFTQPEGPLIHVYISGEAEIEKAKLTYAWPAPF